MNTQYQLCFYSGSQAGKIFPITKEETKIGRDSSCDIVLTENSISRIHVFLYVQQNGSVVLVDNNSTNGTIVNNSQISAPVQLSENDVIGLGGDVMLVFQKVAGFDPGSQWNSTDIPAGNAPDSYNFEKKQGNPMNNDNVNNSNDGATSGFASNNGQDQQPAADNYGFNQTYNSNYGAAGMNQSQQASYGYNQQNPYGQMDMGGFSNNPMPGQNSAAPFDNQSAGSSGSGDYQNPASGFQNIVGGSQSGSGYADSANQPQSSYNAMNENPYSQQQPMMDQSSQMPFGANPYSQQMPQNSFGNSSFQQPMMGQQMPYGNDPYSQQQPMMGQQMPYGNDPYAQQQSMMGQQMPYGNDPYAQQQPMMGQQMPYGNNPYAQQPMMNQQNPYGNNPYAQQYPGMQNQQTDDQEKGKNKKLIITLAIILGVLLIIGIFIFIIDHNRLWCDVFPFLWDADTCANYVR